MAVDIARALENAAEQAREQQVHLNTRFPSLSRFLA